MRVDAHQHFWRYSPQEYAWIDASMKPLQRDFLPHDLTPLMAHAGVTASVAVQARQSLEETEWLLQLSAQEPSIAGVVGWAPIAEADFVKAIEIRMQPKLVGLRHIVQAEPDGFLADPKFCSGIAQLHSLDLTYDILVFARQLNEVIAFVDRFPNQRFVVDHCGKPQIAKGEFDLWAESLRELAKREHVFCKISGLVTEADWSSWSIETIEPYMSVALEAFGANRCMAGSDWPVMLTAATYDSWWGVLHRFAATLSETERAALMGVTANEFYSLGLQVHHGETE